MSAGWAWKGSGSPWTLEAPHGVWAVSELRPGGRAELRYASFDKGGRLSVAPLAIGEFASARDARLTADLYEAEEPLELPEGIADALLPNGGVTEILAPDGRSFLLSLSGEAVTLTSSQGSARSEWARLDQPRVSTRICAAAPLPGTGGARSCYHAQAREPDGHRGEVTSPHRVIRVEGLLGDRLSCSQLWSGGYAGYRAG
jgi:hypothetical protein